MVLGIQILGVLFALFMLYMVFLNWKRKEFTAKEYGFWAVLVILFGTVSLFPNWLNPLVETLNISRTMDFFIIVGFMFLLGAIFYLYLVVRAAQKKIDKVVRKIAVDRKE